METWKIIVSICAGIITILTIFEKLGLTKKFKNVDTSFAELKQVPSQVTSIQEKLHEFGELQKDQNSALLAIIRNSLYQSFRDNRNIASWTDDESNVQNKLHTAYRALHGNGEEELWWEKKKTWNIVSYEDYQDLIQKYNCDKLIKLKK